MTLSDEEYTAQVRALLRPITVKRRLLICDLDGTLCDVSWREQHAQRREWAGFHAGIPQDQPSPAVLFVLRACVNAGLYPLFITGRPEAYLLETREWLSRVWVHTYSLLMRPDGDRRKDTVVKGELLDNYLLGRPDDEIVLVLEDRTTVVDMWRSRGYPCFQVRDSGY